MAMAHVKCPLEPLTPEDDPEGLFNGCGNVFWAAPDKDGWVDCPYCGLGFIAKRYLYPGKVLKEEENEAG